MNITKNSLPLISLRLVAAIIIPALLLTFWPSHRQYSSGIASKDNDEKDNDAIGMAKYFFTARKDINTNALDYPSMIAADAADRALIHAVKTHIASANSLPTFTWNSAGPGSTGGRTRAILIDNNDPTHQTIFAGGVSGGIWKSVNGGSTWGSSADTIAYSLNDTMRNINVSCIAQDSKGAIYIGTGEGFTVYEQGQGFSTGLLGGGMFKSTDDGKTWRLLANTIPTANTYNVTWAYVNRIAIRPDNFKEIYAATQGGLLISHDSGATWRSAWSSTGKKLSGSNYNSLDVKISQDGSLIVACIGAPSLGDPSTTSSYGYYCYTQSGSDTTFTQIPSSGAGRLFGNACRIEFAISPTDPNRVYASVINSNNLFGSGGSGSGIFMTKTALTNGGHWYEIGPGGSAAFDPYFSAFDQSNYDNTLAVAPDNEMELILGGTTFFQWLGTSTNDTIGSWTKISHYNGGAQDPLYIHPDEHAIVFDQNNPNVVYFGCDGGLYKSTNATNAEQPRGHMTFEAINRNYNVTQYYSICFSSQVDYSSGTTGLGLGGGTQDNGSPYINGLAFRDYPFDASDMSGGDGGGSVVSSLNPNIAYFTIDYGTYLGKTGNLGSLTFPTLAFTKTYGVNLGANIDSVASLQSGSFVFPLALYENSYDTLNHDSIQYIATDTIAAGKTIWPVDPNGPTPYPYKITKKLYPGDTIVVPDRVVSRLAVGFSPSNGIWINGQGGSNGSILWMPIAGPLSTPTPFITATQGDAVHSLAWSPDGNTLYAGTEDGLFFKFSNINSIVANRYSSGALFYEQDGRGDIAYNGGNKVISTNLNVAGTSGRDILSISVDPQNGNNVLVTLGNYNNTTYVYYSTNADSASPTFNSVQGNLPAMPVYSSIVNLMGHGYNVWYPGSAMLATEHGIYTTSKLNGNSTVWVKNNKGMANCVTLAVKQQTLPASMCNNSGDIYLGSHGRGAWVSSTNFTPAAVPVINSPEAVADNLRVYPNPMTIEGNLEYTLTASDNVMITIYNIEGKEMQIIPAGTQSPGNHIVPFATSSLPAGAYFASITGTNFRKTGKFIVTK